MSVKSQKYYKRLVLRFVFMGVVGRCVCVCGGVNLVPVYMLSQGKVMMNLCNIYN